MTRQYNIGSRLGVFQDLIAGGQGEGQAWFGLECLTCHMTCHTSRKHCKSNIPHPCKLFCHLSGEEAELLYKLRYRGEGA